MRIAMLAPIAWRTPPKSRSRDLFVAGAEGTGEALPLKTEDDAERLSALFETGHVPNFRGGNRKRPATQDQCKANRVPSLFPPRASPTRILGTHFGANP